MKLKIYNHNIIFKFKFRFFIITQLNYETTKNHNIINIFSSISAIPEIVYIEEIMDYINHINQNNHINDKKEKKIFSMKFIKLFLFIYLYI